MEVVNPFILKNKERMIVFLDQLSSVTDPNPPPGCIPEQNSSSTLSSSDAGKTKPYSGGSVCSISSIFFSPPL